MTTQRRIPAKDGEFAMYVTTTRTYLVQPFLNPISQPVDADTTVNLLSEQLLPENMLLTLTNTGALGVAPPLYFCMANTDIDSCNPATAVQVNAGTPVTVSVKQLGGAGMYHLNVTNTDPADNTGCLVTFQSNWERLGLLQATRQRWENDTALWLNIYLKTQAPETRTKVLVDEKTALKKAFTEFAQDVLRTIEGSVNIVEADYETFNIAMRDDTGTPREPITEAPVTSLTALAGSGVAFRHRTTTDASRASRHLLADSIEIRWMLLDITAPAPVAPENCPNVAFSTKAIHAMQFAVGDAGRRLHTFSRWRNNTEPLKSGPWGGLQSIVLSA